VLLISLSLTITNLGTLNFIFYFRRYGVSFKSASVTEKYGCTFWCSQHEFVKDRKGHIDSSSDDEPVVVKPEFINPHSCNMKMRLSRKKGGYSFKSSASFLSHVHPLHNKEAYIAQSVQLPVSSDWKATARNSLEEILRNATSTADVMLVFASLRKLYHILNIRTKQWSVVCC
jgi:hypothetical protein